MRRKTKKKRKTIWIRNINNNTVTWEVKITDVYTLVVLYPTARLDWKYSTSAEASKQHSLGRPQDIFPPPSVLVPRHWLTYKPGHRSSSTNHRPSLESPLLWLRPSLIPRLALSHQSPCIPSRYNVYRPRPGSCTVHTLHTALLIPPALLVNLISIQPPAIAAKAHGCCSFCAAIQNSNTGRDWRQTPLSDTILPRDLQQCIL